MLWLMKMRVSVLCWKGDRRRMGKGNGISVSYDFPDRWRSLDLRPSVLEEAQTPPHYRRRFGRGGGAEGTRVTGEGGDSHFPVFPPFPPRKGRFFAEEEEEAEGVDDDFDDDDDDFDGGGRKEAEEPPRPPREEDDDDANCLAM